MISVETKDKEIFLDRYLTLGEEWFYKFLLNHATTRLFRPKTKGVSSPEIELMDYHDTFVSFFRNEGNNDYLKIAKLFRRAANKVYRVLLKRGKTKRNDRFLNVV